MKRGLILEKLVERGGIGCRFARLAQPLFPLLRALGERRCVEFVGTAKHGVEFGEKGLRLGKRKRSVREGIGLDAIAVKGQIGDRRRAECPEGWKTPAALVKRFAIAREKLFVDRVTQMDFKKDTAVIAEKRVDVDIVLIVGHRGSLGLYILSITNSVQILSTTITPYYSILLITACSI